MMTLHMAAYGFISTNIDFANIESLFTAALKYSIALLSLPSHLRSTSICQWALDPALPPLFGFVKAHSFTHAFILHYFLKFKIVTSSINIYLISPESKWTKIALKICQMVEINHLWIPKEIRMVVGSWNGWNNLCNGPVQIGVCWPSDISATYIVDGLVVHQENTVAILEGCVRLEDGVELLHYSVCHLGCWIDGEGKIWFHAILKGEPLHEKRYKAGASAATKGVEHKESLESTVNRYLKLILPDCVVATTKVVSNVLLPSNQLLGME